jgi:hypothetical protein
VSNGLEADLMNGERTHRRRRGGIVQRNDEGGSFVEDQFGWSNAKLGCRRIGPVAYPFKYVVEIEDEIARATIGARNDTDTVNGVIVP